MALKVIYLPYISIWYTWNSKQPVLHGCFTWMISNHYMKNCCFTKHPTYIFVSITFWRGLRSIFLKVMTLHQLLSGAMPENLWEKGGGQFFSGSPWPPSSAGCLPNPHYFSRGFSSSKRNHHFKTGSWLPCQGLLGDSFLGSRRNGKMRWTNHDNHDGWLMQV